MSSLAQHLPDRAPAPEEIVGLLADPMRRRLVALLDESDRTAAEIAGLVGTDARLALEQLARLEAAHLVTERDGRYLLDRSVFSRSVRDAASERIGPLNDNHTQLARRYFYRNRLLQLPSEADAIEVVLTLIAEDFQPGEVYSEREVNTTLFGWFGDWAVLRRLLVDHGYLQRDHGRYWRVSPGPRVDL